MNMNIKAMIPAAGSGKRMHGLTGGRPKELLTVGPLTMIEHCLEMVLSSGVNEIVLVIRPDKEELREVAQNYWDRQGPDDGSLDFIYQEKPMGLAQAMGLSLDFAAGLPLAVVLPDNLLLAGPPALAQMIECFTLRPENTIGVLAVTPEKSGFFGNVGRITLKPYGAGLPPLVAYLSPKKPGLLIAPPSGTYYKGFTGLIYLPGWEKHLEDLEPNHEGELDDTDLVQILIGQSRLQAAIFQGRGFDLGNPRGLADAREAWRASADVEP